MSECAFPLCTRISQSNGYCVNHGRVYGGPKPPKEKTPIAKRSEKTKAVMAELKKLYKIFLAKNPTCKANLPGCQKNSTEVHHAKGRVGANATDPKTFVALCHNCHRYVEENPQQAKELGLSKSRLKKD